MVGLVAALSALGCAPTSDPNYDTADLFTGSVKTEAGETLVTFCARLSTSPADVVRFRAPPGTKVVDELMREARTHSWYGGDTGDPPLEFWCSGGGEPSASVAGTFPRCLRVADADPPATLDAAEDRGTSGGGGVPGYALTLTVVHPGVLNLVFDAQCIHDVYGVTRDAGKPHPELTILPN